MGKKGNEFKGLAGGVHYKRMARLHGMNEEFYRKGIGGVTLNSGEKALDLGCGPGALSFALAEKADPKGEITGIDISEDQLDYARKYCGSYGCRMNFRKISMDELPYENNTFDLVVSCMAIHETPPEVRRAAIRETARVLKKGGRFIYVDWSKPKFGVWGILWFPLICWGKNNRDNWNNVYPRLCEQSGLTLTEDYYLNSLARRQVFAK